MESDARIGQYPDFLDSTDVIENGVVLRQRLERDGYLFIRGILSAAAVLAVRARLLAKAAAGGWLDPSSPVEAGIANAAAACKDPEEPYMKVFRGLWADEELHRLRTHSCVLALFERIFAETPLAHPMFVQRNIFPQSSAFDFTTGVHQDRVHIGGATSYALWVPLGDCPREKGALAVAAGSHVHGILETKVGSGAGGMDIAVPIPGDWVTGAFKAGDALIFTDVTVHKALPNRTPEIRMSFDARYQPASQPVADTTRTAKPDMSTPQGRMADSYPVRRHPQFSPKRDSSKTAMTKCVQAAARMRIPGTISNSIVPLAPASRPNRKAVPVAHSAAQAQRS